jgi:hypothetical protein
MSFFLIVNQLSYFELNRLYADISDYKRIDI